MKEQTLRDIERMSNVVDMAIAAKAVDDAVLLLGISILGKMTTMPMPEKELFKRRMITYEALQQAWAEHGYRWVDDLPF